MHKQGNWLHRYAWVVAAMTYLLVVAGALVTSNRAGLAVPDWPTTYGHFMFSFPLGKMVGGIFYEHGHRLIASAVGVMTVVLSLWLARVEPRRSVRWLGVGAVVMVIAQGLLGGLTVKYFLPAPVSVAHASLAQTFLCLTIALAMLTGRRWFDADPPVSTPAARVLRPLALVTTLAIFGQLILGASIRHSDSGLVAHIFAALVVVVCAGSLAIYVLRHWQQGQPRPLAMLVFVLVLVQVGLGLGTWAVRVPKDVPGQLSPVQVLLPTLHLAVGALFLAASFVLTLRIYRLVVAPQETVAVSIASGATAS